MRIVLSLVCAIVVAALPLAVRARALKTPDACALVSDADAFRLLGWSLSGRERRRYAVAGASGSICFLDSSQGKIVVTVPDRGVAFVGATPFNDSGAASLARHVYGLGGDVVLYDGTAFVTRYKRSVSVHVVPDAHPASYDDVEGFAKIVIARLK